MLIAQADGQARRRRESNRKLLEAARRLFVDNGYDATRPQDIARAAGVANGTFYLHFQDKEAVFLAFAEQAQDELVARYEENLDGVIGLGPRLEVILRTMIEYGSKHPGVLQAAFLDPVMIAPNNDDAWRIYDRISDFLSLALGSEVADREPESKRSLSLLSQGICGFMRHAMIFAGRKQLDVDEVINQVVNFVERGFERRTNALRN
ncbi:MAG: TetR/AcrR family transcriptional regulator [Gammaproteobacteria bacterium]|nr:TetR/AcrR family transcriptional regulator [Gammaproteobacteria bacterium]